MVDQPLSINLNFKVPDDCEDCRFFEKYAKIVGNNVTTEEKLKRCLLYNTCASESDCVGILYKPCDNCVTFNEYIFLGECIGYVSKKQIKNGIFKYQKNSISSKYIGKMELPQKYGKTHLEFQGLITKFGEDFYCLTDLGFKTLELIDDIKIIPK